jgi:AcrR family transcriptional regulator
MPRSSNLNRAEILAKAMHYFWEHGFSSAPIDALVLEIGTTRFSLYQQFGSKLGLYTATLDHYSDTAVTQASMMLSCSGAGLERIHNYFEFLIKNAKQSNSLTHGCLMANTMVEFGSSGAQISAKVGRHFERMIAGGDSATEWNLVMATAILAMLPPALVVILMQRWFVKGLVETEK